ncbi:restriction endonuclease subunit S [Bacillus velezensis]|uniref:restriction endonuclease subunit S n=2 Tax=Bacillus velezensis TaxID=492670 RepID=UPI002DBF8B38|nr:restriction endonuclease subunit S [Bacillus velezensis]MEC1382605.1 restriction endonuclease subunit S [Bacillus velezensis]
MSKKKKTIEELLEETLVSEEKQLYEIPENWIWLSLKNSLNSIQYGYTETSSLQAIGPKFLRITDIQNDKVDWSAVPYCKITEKEFAKYKLEDNDIVVARTGATTGKSYLIDKPPMSVFASYLIRLRCNDIMFPRFLWEFMKSPVYWKQITVVKKGSAQPGANAQILGNLSVPLPPLQEQKRITEKVEGLLGKIEEAKQLIEEAKETFELRRAAILDKAFRGELTKKWRQQNLSVDSAAQRLEMIKKERFQIAETKREVSEIIEMFDELNIVECINNNDWLYIKANMFCYNINCGGTPSKDISEEGEIPFLKVYNIVNNKVDFSYKPQYIPKEVHKSKLKKSMLRPNDVIMNIVGPPLKKIAIIPEEYSEMNMNQAIVRFRPIKYVLPKYLYYCLQYDETLRDVINETRGVVGQSNISVSQSRNLVMPIPSIEEQAEIVSKLEEMIKREEIVLSLVSDEKNLDELKQSILSKAFRGELGTNDPSEESAIELLKEVLQEQVK